MIKQIKAYMMILLTLMLLVSSSKSYYHKPLARHYLVELDESNLNVTAEFIDFFYTVIDIHQIISHTFLQAVSIELKENSSISLLYDHSSVLSISPIQSIHRTDFAPLSNDISPTQVGLVSTHHLSQVDKVHQELKLTGQGVFIGVIDSGVDYYHPALGGGFGPGFKVIAGYDFVGDHWNSSDPNSKPEPDDNPLDNCGKSSGASGHGTHVSGIIAGFDEKLNFTGVAPGAKLGMWRVFSCQGDARTDVIIAAMLMAFDAGVDIISMSLGSNIPWSAPHSILSKIVSKISASGISVVISAGNSGSRGVFTTSTPGNIGSALAVASVNNEYILFDGALTATGISKSIGFNYARDVNLTMSDGYLVPSHHVLDSPSFDACSKESVSPLVKGNIALVKRGDCDFISKVNHIASKGAIGAIIYDDKDEMPFTVILDKSTIPVYAISLEDGLLLLNAYNFKQPKSIFLKFSIGKALFKSKYGKIVSTFSSIGPTAELDFKPNIAAVGQLVYSTLPRYLENWGFKQGTSMACPYVAGSIALYLEYHGKNSTRRNKVHEKFQNLAMLTSIDNNTSGYLENPLLQGAGIIQVYDTILETSSITPSQISFNDTFTSDYRIQNLAVTNNGMKRVSYKMFNNVSVSISPYNLSLSGYAYVQPVSKKFNYARIKFSMNQIFLLPGQSQTVQVYVYPPNTNPLEHVMYGGFIQFKSIDRISNDLHVPYFGVVGSQRDLPILDKIRIKVESNDTLYDIKKDITFDLVSLKSNSLLIYFKLFKPTLVLKGELISNFSKSILGFAFPPLACLQRDFFNDTRIRSPVIWKGKYLKKLPYDILDYSEENKPEIPLNLYSTVGVGNYSIRISALKQFGDMKNEQDWEYFFIGPIIIK